MANPLRAEVEVEIQGNTRILRLGLQQMVELQDYLGRGAMALAQGEGGTLDIKEAIAVIHFGLRGAGVEGQTLKQTTAMLEGTSGIMLCAWAMAALLKGVRVMVGSEAEKKKDEANP